MKFRIWHLTILLYLTTGARADSWDDFANNLATDLAPLIQLFGETITKQFLSESLDIWDNIIFACAPLGILTAVVSAIRVCGSSSLKAFIGRAQESEGTSEVELLSCTSETTAEVWNDGGITRVFGRPQISEFVFVESEARRDVEAKATTDQPPSAATYGIRTMTEFLDTLGQIVHNNQPSEQSRFRVSVLPTAKDACKEKKIDKNLCGWRCLENSSDLRLGGQPTGGPNLSLNVGIKRLPRRYFYAAAICGLLLQLAVLVFATVTVFIQPEDFLKNGLPVSAYGLPCTAAGTVLLCGGMFLCAFLIEQRTIEDYHLSDGTSQVWWVQPGGQKIGDQVVGPFVGMLDSNLYIRSRKGVHRDGSELLLWSAVLMSMAGFVVQFVGLRALHSSVTLLQLGSTLLMSVVRASLRASRMKATQNLVPQKPVGKLNREIYGHELDFLAYMLVGCGWIDIAPITRMDQVVQQKPIFSLARVARGPPRPGPDPVTPKTFRTSRVELIKVRARVGELHEAQFGKPDLSKSSSLAENLKHAVEGSMEVLESFMISPAADDANTWLWQVGIWDIHGSGNYFGYPLQLAREARSAWSVCDPFDLQALIGLWSWEPTPRFSTKRRVVVDSDEGPDGYGLQDYEAWMQRRMRASEPGARLSPLDAQHEAGFPVKPNHGGNLYVYISGSTDLFFTQDLYMLFLEEALKPTMQLRGKISLRSGSIARSGKILPLQNSRIERLATIFETASLGNREEAYMVILPILMRQRKLPTLKKAYRVVLRQAVRDEDEDTLRLLIDRNLHDVSVHRDGSTALHLAVVQNSGTAIIKMLLEAPAPPLDAVTVLGKTALHEAAQLGKASVVKMLIEAGADRDSRDACGRTPLYVAVLNNKHKIVKLLISKGADVNIPTKDQLSPLFRAVLSSKRLIIQALMEGGADQKIKDLHGWGPAHIAWALHDKARIRAFPKLKVSGKPLGAPPSCWEAVTHRDCKFFNFSDDKIVAETPLETHSASGAIATTDIVQLQANHPVPLGKYVFYFELTITKLPQEGFIGVGLSNDTRDLDTEMPGWTSCSWGYHGGDGRKRHAATTGFSYGPTFGAGDTVGCGLDLGKRTCFFTKNAKFLGTAFWNLKGRLVPLVAIRNGVETGTCIRANFTGPFLWTEQYKGPERKPRRTLGDLADDDSVDDVSYSSSTDVNVSGESVWTDDGLGSDSDGDSSDDTDGTSDEDSSSSEDSELNTSGSDEYTSDSSSDNDSTSSDNSGRSSSSNDLRRAPSAPNKGFSERTTKGSPSHTQGASNLKASQQQGGRKEKRPTGSKQNQPATKQSEKQNADPSSTAKRSGKIRSKPTRVQSGEPSGHAVSPLHSGGDNVNDLAVRGGEGIATGSVKGGGQQQNDSRAKGASRH